MEGISPNSYRVMAFADSIRWLACVVQPVDVPARGRAPRVDRSGCAAPSLALAPSCVHARAFLRRFHFQFAPRYRGPLGYSMNTSREADDTSKRILTS